MYTSNAMQVALDKVSAKCINVNVNVKPKQQSIAL